MGDVDRGALDGLTDLGLLRLRYSSGRSRKPNYRLTNDGRRYYQWLQEQRGQPIEQVEDAVTRWLNGYRFAQRYPRASVALGKAFHILWSGEQLEQAVGTLDADLRAALQDFMDELLQHLAVASDVSREKPIQRLREATAAVADRVGPRETAVLEQLVELADVTLKQVQRVHHTRDESKPIAGWDELRRTGFLLAMLMHELDKVAES